MPKYVPQNFPLLHYIQGAMVQAGLDDDFFLCNQVHTAVMADASGSVSPKRKVADRFHEDGRFDDESDSTSGAEEKEGSGGSSGEEGGSSDDEDANASPKPKITKFDDDDATEEEEDAVGDLPFSKLNIDNDEEEEDQEFSQQMY